MLSGAWAFPPRALKWRALSLLFEPLLETLVSVAVNVNVCCSSEEVLPGVTTGHNGLWVSGSTVDRVESTVDFDRWIKRSYRRE
eukprot:939549-Prorocentrum_minimum.AAC.3